MDKILLVLKREYLVRIRKRTFLIMTLLTPILLAALFVVPVWLASSFKSEKIVEVIDESGEIGPLLQDQTELKFIKSKINKLADAKAALDTSKSYALLYIPKNSLEKPDNIKIFSKKSISIDIERDVREEIENRMEDLKLTQSGIDKEVLANIKTDVNLGTETLSGEESSAGAATMVGFIAMFAIYMAVFLYGSQVMRGVIEEKSSRIIEVIISSVKPFQLMMGKILGVGLVGVTQFILWIGLTYLLLIGAASFLDLDKVAEDQAKAQQETEIVKVDEDASVLDKNAKKTEQTDKDQKGITKIFSALGTINLPLVVGAFLFYFVGGYMLYSALFAAVASAVDNEADTQQFQLPISVPLIVGFMIAQISVIKDPDGIVAVWASIIPFTSPVVMMARLPFGGVAIWELAVSMIALVGGFIFTTWVAARIYRIGILMHGKKPTFKELGKWIFYKM
jgi:ABC-2 type transport system permease protein